MIEALRGLLESAREALSVWAYDMKRQMDHQREIDYVENERNKDD